MRADLKFPFYAKASLVFIGLFALIAMLYFGQGIIVPVIYATIIAIVLSPLVNALTTRGINRVIAIFITLLLIILFTVMMIFFLYNRIIQFSHTFPRLVEKLHYMSDQVVNWTSLHFDISAQKINLWINDKSAEMMSAGGSDIGQTLIDTGGMLVVLVLIPVYTFMILYYQPLLLQFIRKLFKSSNAYDVNEVLLATKKIIRSYLIGLLLEAGIVAMMNVASLLLLGIEYAVLLGVLGALLNVIPYIGGIVAVALPMMIAMATKSSPSYALFVLAAYIFIQFIDNHYIIPKVVASKVKINALISIIVVLAGGALWGIPGMFLSIPLTAIIKVIFDHIESMEAWGYLLGDTMPSFRITKLLFKRKNMKIEIKN